MNSTAFTASANHGLQVGSAGDVYYHSYPPSQPGTKPKPTTTVPFRRDKDFIHRKELDEILEKCNSPFARAALVGLGGIGKSQIAIEFSWRIREASPDTWVFWVHASNSARILEGYKKIAESMDIPNATNDILQLVGSWLTREENGKWVVIVDNADDIDVLKDLSQDCLPEVEHGRVLVTSRSKDAAQSLVGYHDDILDLDAMSCEDGKALFRAKCHHSQKEDELTNLVMQLEYVPLAITQAASFIQKWHPRMTISKYLEIFNRTDLDIAGHLSTDIIDRRRDRDAQNSVILTWQISFEYIQSKQRSAADLLSFMSLCDRQGIPEMLISEGMKTAGSQNSLDIDLEILRDYSLIALDLSGKVFEMHRLVQLATRAWLEKASDLERWKAVYVQTMEEVFPSGSYGTWEACSILFAHVQMLLQYSLTEDDLILSKALALDRAGYYSRERGQYLIARTFHEEALASRKKVLGKDHREVLTSMDNLALVLRHQGEYKESEQLHRQALAGYEKVFGEDHPDTLISMNNLTIVLSRQGKYGECERLNRQTLASKERVLGKDHPSTLTSMDNLAFALSHQGKYKESEQLHRQALTGSKKVLGEDHPDTLTGMDNLAIVLNHQGKYEESERLHRQTLASKEKVLGKDHPSTMTSINNLALTLGDQGKYEESEQLYRQVLASKERVPGEDYSSTLTSIDNLATTLRYQGKYEQAKEFNLQALSGYEKVLGKDHPDTLISMNNLAQVFKHQGKYKEAEEFVQQALAGREKVLGKDHPHTLNSFNLLKEIHQLIQGDLKRKANE